MPTKDEILKEQIRREQIRREQARRQQPAEASAQAPAQTQPHQDDGLLYQIPGIGPYIKSADTAVSNVIGRAPNAQEGKRGLADMIETFADTYSYGLGNKAAGKEYMDKAAAARERLGYGALPVDLAAGVLSPSILARGPLMAYKGMKTGANILEGGGTAALDAWAHGAPVSSLPGEFLKGSGVSAAAQKVAKTGSEWLQRLQAKRGQTFKTNADLAKAKSEKYAEVDVHPGVYRARDLRALHAQLQQMNLVPGVDDAAINVLKKLDKDWKGKNMTAAELDKVQQSIRAKVSGTPNLNRISGDMIDVMRQFEKQTPLVERVVDPTTGRISYKQTSQDVKKSLETARNLAAREQRLKSVLRMERRAQSQTRAGRFNPFGPSLESARVKQAAQLNERIAEGKTKTSPYTAPEKAGLKQLEEGTFRRNLGGYAEHLAPSGKIGKFFSLLHAVPGASAVTAPVQIAAEALHRTGQRATTREIKDLQALIRDPSGKGLRTDPATTAKAKEMLAKMMSATYRGSENQKRNRGKE